MRGRRLGASLAFKQRVGVLLNCLLPLPNLHGMHPVRLPYLVDRLHPAQCFQTDLRLELGGVDLPLLRFAHYGVLLMTEHSLIYCLKTWVHYTLDAGFGDS